MHIKVHATNEYVRVEIQLHTFSVLALNGGK